MTFVSSEDASNVAVNEARSFLDAEGVPHTQDNAPLPENAGRDDLWARITVLPGSSAQASIGSSPLHRTDSVLSVQLFAQLNRGSGGVGTLAGKVQRKFRSLLVGGLTFRSPSVRRVGRSGEYWQVNVSCPFYHEEIN